MFSLYFFIIFFHCVGLYAPVERNLMNFAPESGLYDFVEVVSDGEEDKRSERSEMEDSPGYVDTCFSDGTINDEVKVADANANSDVNADADSKETFNVLGAELDFSQLRIVEEEIDHTLPFGFREDDPNNAANYGHFNVFGQNGLSLYSVTWCGGNSSTLPLEHVRKSYLAKRDECERQIFEFINK